VSSGADGGTFFVGQENRLVEVLVHSVLDANAPKYNPIVIAGAAGTGKSHLARGLAAAYRGQHARAAVVCEAAIDFARKLADALDGQGIADFRRRYRSARLLVLDDIGQLAGREMAQRELQHTIDASIEAGNQVIVTAHSPPGQWIQIAAALQSRLEAGLCVPLAAPGRETRMAIVQDVAERRGLAIGEPVARLLADRLDGDVRELLGSVNKLHARRILESRPVDVEMARALLDELDGGRPAVELRDIAVATARAFSLPLGQMKSRSRRRETVAARGVAMYLARQLTDLSLEQIGRYFGGRDHTTVLHSCRKTEGLLREEPVTQRMVEQVEKALCVKAGVQKTQRMVGVA
jgi:chromosomal replication initiator protein